MESARPLTAARDTMHLTTKGPIGGPVGPTLPSAAPRVGRCR